MRALGDKARARMAVIVADVPVISVTDFGDDMARAKKQPGEVGYVLPSGDVPALQNL